MSSEIVPGQKPEEWKDATRTFNAAAAGAPASSPAANNAALLQSVAEKVGILEHIIPGTDLMSIINDIMNLFTSNVDTLQKLALVQSKLQQLPIDMQKFYTDVRAK